MTHIQQRRDTAAEWTAKNPVLYDGEVGWETNTRKSKIGNGTTPWNNLPYLLGVHSVAGRTGDVNINVGDVNGAAPLASPEFVGEPTAPTPIPGEASSRIATTKFVDTAVEMLVSNVLDRYDDTKSLIAFGGFPGTGVRYNPAEWSIPIPAGTRYAMIHLTSDGRAPDGTALITYILSVGLDAGAYTDVQDEQHHNSGDVYQSLNASLSTNVDTQGADTLRVRLGGIGGENGAVTGTRYCTLRVTFMGSIEFAV